MGSIHYTVYKTTNLINGKTYIGMHKTTDPNDDYLGSGKYLKRAIAKHGAENFTKEILFSFDNEEDMRAKEAELVTEEYCQSDDNYNLCNGGKGGFGYLNRTGKNMYGENGFHPASEINFEKLKSKLGEIFSDPKSKEKHFEKIGASLKEHYANNGSHWTGRKHSQSTKDKMSLANSKHQSGSGNSQHGKKWIYNEVLKECKKIPKSEPLPEGWSFGRKMRFD